ncbi:hypothetical protein IGI04_001134 [Brassica rapa subsp. trilocularis]|uniref:Uncharacterized protein n=1 Tax=Brassica rapa subsp. trilocularis TaxID=1813537 RepID=A0ABQ7NRS6_BRACM|nr:hypothetical protein IGI04_001134 [Brassica rapa subsp. trilocularis]
MDVSRSCHCYDQLSLPPAPLGTTGLTINVRMMMKAASMRNQQYYQNGRSHPLDNIHGMPQNMLTNGNSGIVSMICC